MFRRALVILSLCSALFVTTSCTPRGALLGLHAAAVVTEVIVAASILAYHDAHYHNMHCGHRHRYYDGRYNYWYGGHWEYYDDGRWYGY